MSRVGNGPFISEFGGKRSELYCAEGQGRAHIKEREFQDYRPGELLQSKDLLEVGTALRMLGNEYGATTKRPRRIGMLDLVMLKQNCLINGVDKLYLNKFDSLADFRRTSLPGIPLVVAYELEGRTIDYLPTSIKEMERTKPVVEYFPNFPDLSGIRNPADLPPEAKELISFIEQKVGTKIAGIGVGPERDQFIEF
jgi:adenylosuccinate synthase